VWLQTSFLLQNLDRLQHELLERLERRQRRQAPSAAEGCVVDEEAQDMEPTDDELLERLERPQRRQAPSAAEGCVVDEEARGQPGQDMEPTVAEEDSEELDVDSLVDRIAVLAALLAVHGPEEEMVDEPEDEPPELLQLREGEALEVVLP